MLSEGAPEDWQPICEPVHLCTLPFSRDELAVRFGLTFESSEVRGLGQVAATVVCLNDTALLFSSASATQMESHSTPSEVGGKISVMVQAQAVGWSAIIDALCDELGIARVALVWEQQELVPGTWQLLRQDDNGNTFEMFRFPDEMRATQAREVYKQRGHKQTYFVQRVK